MENHPLSPMTGADIRRWLSLQTRYTMGHIPADQVFAGSVPIQQSLEHQHRAGHRYMVVDAIRDEALDGDWQGG